MGQTNIALADVRTFRSLAGLPASDPQVLLVPGSNDPGIVNSEIKEADLDVEWAGAVAPNASIVFVYTKNVFDAMNYAIAHDLAPVISISYGLCEQLLTSGNVASFMQTTSQANAEGITIVAASGDNGAADCDSAALATHGLAVDFPASLPTVTGIGGTEFNEGTGTLWNTTNSPAPNGGSAISYIPEKVWNDTVAGSEPSASGGGKSTFFPKPSWQTGVGVPNDSARDVPDVSIAASADHDGYVVCTQGSCVTGYRNMDNGNLAVVGGTSIGVPTFAGVLALINQQTALAQGNVGTGQGNVNYVLYPLAANSTNIFHDITTGNNLVACQAASTADCPAGGSGSIGFQATAGYDLATGLGSMNVYNLVTTWPIISPTTGTTGDFQLSVSPANLSLAQGATGTAQISMAGINGFAPSGSSSFSCSVPSGLAGVGCSVQPSAANTWTLTVTTVSAGLTVRNLLRHWHFPVSDSPALPIFAGVTAAGVLVFLALLLVRRNHAGFGLNFARFPLPVSGTYRRSGLAFALVCVMGAVCFGCNSSGHTQTPASNGTTSTSTSTSAGTSSRSGAITIQGTNSGITHTVQISVTVN